LKPSRMALYIFIALIAMWGAYYLMVKEPHPFWPINLIHLLARH
jgi:hypothetical protein